MKNALKSLRKPENITLVLAVAISLGFLVFDIIQPVPGVVPKATLSVLGVLAFAMLAERLGYFERFEQALRDIKQEKGPFLQVRADWVPFEKYARDAREISVSGGSLAQLVPRYREFFERKARSGCKLRFILLNPDSPALGAVAGWAAAPADRFKMEIGLSLSHLRQIKDTGCEIEVRLNDTIPALSVMIFDASKPHGRIRVDLQLYQCAPPRRPCFELTRAPYDQEEEDLFQDFLAQYERLWDQSTPLDELGGDMAWRQKEH
jgi:hypothetical protein